jgi:hypothetical protein
LCTPACTHPSYRYALLPKNRPRGDSSLESENKKFEKTMRLYLDHKDAEEELGLALVEGHEAESKSKAEEADKPGKDGASCFPVI